MRRVFIAGALALQLLLLVPVPTLAGPLDGALGTVDEALGDTGSDGALSSTPAIPPVQIGGGALPQVSIGGGQGSTTPPASGGGGGVTQTPQGSSPTSSSPAAVAPSPSGAQRNGRRTGRSTGDAGRGAGSGSSRSRDGGASRREGGAQTRSGGGAMGTRSDVSRGGDRSHDGPAHRRRGPLSFPAQVVERIPAAYRLSLMALAAIAAIFALVTLRERRRSEQATQDALSDPLTGLTNRLGFEQQLALEWKRAQRYDHQLGLLMIDLDDFKEVNDTRGHAAGDRVLREAAATISGRVRETDVPARLGGDEFVVICPETGKDGLETLARGLRQTLAEHAIGASVGVAQREQYDVSPEDLVARADEAMYEHKRRGRPPAAQQDTLTTATASS